MPDEASPRGALPEEARPGFQYYANASGESNVRAFQIEPESITVEFRDGSRYLYTYASAGKSNVEFMKRLARHGFGLNGYITKHVRKMYASKA